MVVLTLLDASRYKRTELYNRASHRCATTWISPAGAFANTLSAQASRRDQRANLPKRLFFCKTGGLISVTRSALYLSPCLVQRTNLVLQEFLQKNMIILIAPISMVKGFGPFGPEIDTPDHSARRPVPVFIRILPWLQRRGRPSCPSRPSPRYFFNMARGVAVCLARSYPLCGG